MCEFCKQIVIYLYDFEDLKTVNKRANRVLENSHMTCLSDIHTSDQQYRIGIVSKKYRKISKYRYRIGKKIQISIPF